MVRLRLNANTARQSTIEAGSFILHCAGLWLHSNVGMLCCVLRQNSSRRITSPHTTSRSANAISSRRAVTGGMACGISGTGGLSVRGMLLVTPSFGIAGGGGRVAGLLAPARLHLPCGVWGGAPIGGDLNPAGSASGLACCSLRLST